jgi:hypothetical protein
LTRATRAGIALAGVLLVVLGASGAWLWWNYRPDRDQWIRTTHQVAAIAVLVVAVVLACLAILRRRQTRASGVVASIGLLVAIAAAYVLGRLIAWDGLGFHAVVSEAKGVDTALQSSVFVISVDGHTVSPSTYATWAYAHLVLAGLAVVALLLVLLRLRERPGQISPRTQGPATAPEPAPEPRG